MIDVDHQFRDMLLEHPGNLDYGLSWLCVAHPYQPKNVIRDDPLSTLISLTSRLIKKVSQRACVTADSVSTGLEEASKLLEILPQRIHPIGFEPITLGSEDRCAIQLRHGCMLKLLSIEVVSDRRMT